MTGLHQPTREECVLRYIIDRQADEQPDKVFLKNEDGREWTYAALKREVVKAAAALQSLGVAQGHFVFGWLPNSPELVITWFAVNYLGAVWVPTNIAYRGKLLEHAINLSDARVGVVHADLLARLNDIQLSELTDLVVVGGNATEDPRLRFHDHSIFAEDRSLAPLDAPIEPWDNIYIIFTSGTTGPSKAVLTSYAMMWYSNVEAWSVLTSETRYLVAGPLFHDSTTGFTYEMLAIGGSIALVESFKTSQFWDVIRRTGATTCTLLGVMAPYLLKEPPSPRDRDHPLKIVTTSPWGEHCLAFGRRFGVDLYTAYSMSEIPCPIVSEINPPKFGVAGRKRDGFDLRIVDEHDYELPVGQIGEMIVRSDRPWALLTNYHKNPAATAAAWRNGWFHTGDAMRVDEEGYYYFVDRMKDAIRRRGENISSFEVEAAVLEHPDIRECAALAMPNEISEDEVMVCVITQPDSVLDPAELITFLLPRVAHFMVPRFVRIVTDMPRTPSGKIQKAELRKEGLTTDTWDRERAGIVVKREKIAQAGRSIQDPLERSAVP